MWRKTDETSERNGKMHSYGQLNTTVSVNVEKEDISKLEEEGQEYSVLTWPNRPSCDIPPYSRIYILF